MATSIQVVQGQAKIFNDLDLFVVLRFMLEEMMSNPKRYQSLQAMFSIWEDCCVASGPGTIDLKLDRLAASESSKSEIRELLSAVREKLAEWGDRIPKSILNTRYAVRGIHFADYETSRLVETTEKIQNLLEPEI